MIKKKWHTLVQIMLSVLTAAALCLDMGIPDLHMVPETERVTIMNMPEMIWNLYGSFNLKAFPVLAVSVFSFNFYYDKKKCSRAGGAGVPVAFISCFFAGAFVMAEGFCMADTLAVLYSSSGQMIKTLVSFAGFSYFYYQLISCICLFFDFQKKGNLKEISILKTFLTIMAGWLPYIIILYPGNITSDAYAQLSQFLGISEWSSHHPPFSTMFMGAVFSIGRVISGNAAVFLYCLIQTVIFALILSYMLKLFYILGAPRWLYLFTVFCIFTVPYYTNYIMVVVKDSMYSYCFLLFMIELVYFSIQGIDYFKSGKHMFLWMISVCGTILFRNNGSYVIVPTILAISIFCVYRGVKDRAEQIRKYLYTVGCIAASVITAAVISLILMSQFDIRKGSIAEALSLPLQQTARYVYYHQDEITLKEEDVLSAILDYDNLARNYNPRVSDPVKSTFKYNPSYQELLSYFRVWFLQGIKHPETYLAATMNQNYYLFYPLVPNNIVFAGLDGLGGFSNAGNGIKLEGELFEILNLHETEILKKPKMILFLFYQAYFYLPVIGWIAHPATYIFLLICLYAFAFRKKIYKWIVVALPVFLSFLVVIFAPAIQRHPRYAFPIIYSMPLLLAYYLYCNKKIIKGND